MAAQFTPAFDFLLNSEDSQRKYAEVPDPVPVNEGDSLEVKAAKQTAKAISGINSYYHPIAFVGVQSTPQAARGPLVAEFYEKSFWNPLHLGELASQDLASRLLDCAVNQGPGTAVQLLQKAINAVVTFTGETLVVDGRLGGATLAAANRYRPQTILDAFRKQRLARYQEVKNPVPAAWAARANA